MYLHLQIEIWHTDVFLSQHMGGLFYSSHTEILWASIENGWMVSRTVSVELFMAVCVTT